MAIISGNLGSRLAPSGGGGKSIFGGLLGRGRATLAALPPSIKPVAPSVAASPPIQMTPSIAQGFTAFQQGAALIARNFPTSSGPTLGSPSPSQRSPASAGSAGISAGLSSVASSLMGRGAVVQSAPTQGRRQNLGFPATSVTASATTQAESAPQTIFRPDRLFIASGITAKFNVASVVIGNLNQFVNDKPCPGAMFSELAVNADVEYDTSPAAVTIAVGLTNLDTTATQSATPGMTGRSAY